MDTSLIVGIVVAVVLLAVVVIALVLHNRSSKNGADKESQAGAPTATQGEERKKPATATEPAAQKAAASVAETAGKSTDKKAAAAQKPVTGETEGAEKPAPAESAEETAPAASAAEPVATETAAEAAPAVEAPEGKSSRMTRLRAKLAKSANPFGKALFSILTKDNLSESDWEDIEDTLILADVGTDTAEQVVDALRSDARVNNTKDAADVHAALRQMLLDQVGPDMDRSLMAERDDARHPSVIIMVGVNGTGKTTTAGKLARLFVAEGKKVVLGAADTFRAAAADQLETWGGHVGVPVVRSDRDGADPASVAFDAAQKAIDLDADVLIIDTAGRLQNKSNLMDELGKIRRVVEKKLPVDEVLLVLDATTGQNGMMQAKVFSEAIGVTGVALTKLDGSAKGGIVIAVQKELGVPVKLVGLGEGPDDLSPFDPAGFVDGILGD